MTQAEKRQTVAKIAGILEARYPDAVCSLDWGTTRGS